MNCEERPRFHLDGSPRVTSCLCCTLSPSLSLNCMLWNTHTLHSFAVSHSASPSITFCLGDPLSPLFLLFNAPFHCPSQPVWMLFPGLWTATSHLLSWSLFVFFPSIAFLMHFLSYANSFSYIVLYPHAVCFISGTIVSSAFRCCSESILC